MALLGYRLFQNILNLMLKKEAIELEHIQKLMYDYLVYKGREDYKLLLDMYVTYRNQQGQTRIGRIKAKAISCNRTFIKIVFPHPETSLEQELKMNWDEYGENWCIMATTYVPKETRHHWEV